jgi:hypothetical protein
VPRCSSCGCDLAGLEELCSKCFEARYAEIDRPKSLLESIRQFGSNPLRQHEIEKRIKAQPWWLAWCFAVIGVGCDWYSAFEWFCGRYSLRSGSVLRGLVLIVALCASIAFLAVRRRTAISREFPWAFFAFSYVLFGFMIRPYARRSVVECGKNALRLLLKSGK